MQRGLLSFALLPFVAAAQDVPAPADTPAWARRAVWYQLFPERFRNGDFSNDPTPESMEGAWPQVGAGRLREAGWRPTPWTHDWYRQQDWERDVAPGDFYTTVQLRRYGGDLQGVLDKLGYLDSLGVTALYFNPLNDAPGLHKYDARSYHHLDVHFGPDPDGDRRRMEREDPADPQTWRFSSADSLFLRVVAEAHRREMRVVMDYSWNHTGLTFWAFRDAAERGTASPYADWYHFERFDNPSTPDTSELAYEGWAGVRELPNLRKVDFSGDPRGGVPYEGNLLPEIKSHVFDVTRRWLDPDGDGDPSDGVDGFRLDVAEQVPLGFWRDYRRFVKGINPDAALIGEIWWQRWPTVMSDPRPYLGNVFDGVMHYRWYAPTRSLVTGAPPALTPSRYAAHLDSLFAGIAPQNLHALMSTAGTHDAPRLATELLNPEIPYKQEPTPRAHAIYRTTRPDADAGRAQDLVLLVQFTLPSAPHLFYGDEAGMWGADDPDNRKPMVWADLRHAPEATDSQGRAQPPQTVAVNEARRAFYSALIALRREHADLLSEGAWGWVRADDAANVLAYRRRLDEREALVVLNLAGRAQTVAMPEAAGATMRFRIGQVEPIAGGLQMPARSAAVLVRGLGGGGQ